MNDRDDPGLDNPGLGKPELGKPDANHDKFRSSSQSSLTLKEDWTRSALLSGDMAPFLSLQLNADEARSGVGSLKLIADGMRSDLRLITDGMRSDSTAIEDGARSFFSFWDIVISGAARVVLVMFLRGSSTGIETPSDSDPNPFTFDGP